MTNIFNAKRCAVCQIKYGFCKINKEHGHPSRTGQTVEARRRETSWSSRLGVGRKASNLAPEKKPNTAKNAQLWKAGRKDNRRPKQVPRNKKKNATRPKGRPRLRWEEDARNDLRKMGVKN
jgi:hypothetical protein